MISIIIAGGSGTRLWPLSTSSCPKQFLEVDDSGRSLLQKTYDRVKDISERIYIVTCKELHDKTAEQLPQIAHDIVVEPSRGGLANAYYLGLRRLKADGYGDDQQIFVLWADHLIHDDITFQTTVKEASHAVENGLNLVQFGIVPTYASNQLGYIKKGKELDGQANTYEIESWKYQPDQDTANEWFASGEYLWNAAYFVTTPRYTIGEIKRGSQESYASYEAIVNASDSDLDKVYTSQQVALLDHVLSEKMQNAHVIACTFDWIDVGNFHDLHSVSSLDDEGNYIKGQLEQIDVTDAYVHNELDVPLAIVGLDNIVVVATKNGILVASKSHARRVGEIAKKIQSSQK